MPQACWWCIITIHQGYRSTLGAIWLVYDWYFCNFLSGFTLTLPLIRALVSSSVKTYSPKTAMQKPCLNSSESWVMFRSCLFSHLPVSNDLHRFEIMSILQKEETLVWVLAPHDSDLECPLIADVLYILSYMANIRRNLLNWPLNGPTMFDSPYQTIKLLTWPMEASSWYISGTITSHRPRIASLRII